MMIIEENHYVIYYWWLLWQERQLVSLIDLRINEVYTGADSSGEVHLYREFYVKYRKERKMMGRLSKKMDELSKRGDWLFRI